LTLEIDLNAKNATLSTRSSDTSARVFPGHQFSGRPALK
jgi:hypothetical protein